MIKQRSCCHCGGTGPFVRVVTCQDAHGEVFEHLCLCVACEGAFSDGAFRERVRAHIEARRSPVLAGVSSSPSEYGLRDGVTAPQ